MKHRDGHVPYPQQDGSTVWAPNSVWADDMIFVEMYTTGNGGHRVIFKSLLTDLEYEMMMRNFQHIIPYMESGRVKGNFTFTKSSTSHYIKFVEDK